MGDVNAVLKQMRSFTQVGRNCLYFEIGTALLYQPCISNYYILSSFISSKLNLGFVKCGGLVVDCLPPFRKVVGSTVGSNQLLEISCSLLHVLA